MNIIFAKLSIFISIYLHNGYDKTSVNNKLTKSSRSFVTEM